MSNRPLNGQSVVLLLGLLAFGVVLTIVACHHLANVLAGGPEENPTLVFKVQPGGNQSIGSTNGSTNVSGATLYYAVNDTLTLDAYVTCSAGASGWNVHIDNNGTSQYAGNALGQFLTNTTLGTTGAKTIESHAFNGTDTLGHISGTLMIMDTADAKAQNESAVLQGNVVYRGIPLNEYLTVPIQAYLTNGTANTTVETEKPYSFIWNLTRPANSTASVDNLDKLGTNVSQIDWYGNYTLKAKAGNSSAPKEVTIVAIEVDLDVDTDNDGEISSDSVTEEPDEEDAPGAVVAVDRAGQGAGYEDLEEIRLDISPNLTVGTLTLNASIGGSKIKIWKETAMQNQVALPKTYNLSSDSIDGTLYVDGTDTGEVMLDLHYKDPSGAEIQRDKVKLLITPTVSYSPRGWFVYAWEPALYHLSKEGLEALEEEVGDSGWTVVCYEDSAVDDDCEDCTLLAFESMKYGGVVAPHSHSAVSGFCAVFYNTSVSCNEWRDGEDHMTTVRWGEEQKWYVKAEPEWFNDNWADKLDANRAIVVWMCCHAAEGGQDSIVQQAGGRTAFAYVGTTDSGKHAHNMERLFGQLNGTLYAGTNRTAGKAYAGGAGYQGNFTMVGSNWTTLHPAPYDVFPNAPTNGKEGYGCIIFDTYMKDTVSANQAVVKDSGGGTVGPRYWFGHAGGNWSIGYYFDTTTGAITMRAEADNCENETSDGVQTRYMAGDRQTYRADKNWTF